MIIIDIARLETALQKSLTLLRDTYTEAPNGGGGWYHRLDVPPPGATATAVALMAFDVAGEKAPHLPECLKFLAERQVQSPDPALDGGWATNTSLRQPVVEATGWVVQCLGLLGCGLMDGAPDLQRGYLWLIRNQNPDGGWGSFLGMPSRTWLTCLAMQALARVNPYHESLARAVQWLADSPRKVPHAWGKDLLSTPTVTHTAFALRTLSECGYSRADDKIRKAYAWLVEHLDTTSLDEAEARVEEYRGLVSLSGQDQLWRSPALIHYALPIAASALACVPAEMAGAATAKLSAALETILAKQNPQGYWPNIYDSGITLWGVWPCIHALSTASRVRLTGNGELVSFLEGVVIIQDPVSRQRPLPEALAGVLPRRSRINIRQTLRRTWAWFVLGIFATAGLIGVGVRAITLNQFGFGLILPMALLVISLTYTHLKD